MAYHSDLNDKQKMLMACEGIKSIYGKASHYGNKPLYFYADGENEVKVPDNVYVEIDATATAGTIGRLIDIDFTTHRRYDFLGNEIDAIDMYGVTYIIEIDGRKKPSRISAYHSSILGDYTGPTKWVRNVNKKKKEVVQNPVNKFKQTLNKDDWIVGVGQGYGANKPLMIGKVSRWTKHNVWATSIDGNEFKLNDIRQTFLLPSSDEYADELMMAVVKGWNGR